MVLTCGESRGGDDLGGECKDVNSDGDSGGGDGSDDHSRSVLTLVMTASVMTRVVVIYIHFNTTLHFSTLICCG